MSGCNQIPGSYSDAIRESWADFFHDKVNVLQTVVAGSLSGLVADICAYVPNRFKTLMMAQGAKRESATLSQLYYRVRSKQGARGLMTGISPVLALALPSNAAFFATVEFTKKTIDKRAFKDSVIPNCLLSLLPGLGGQVVAGAAGWTTTEVLKEAMQRQTEGKPRLTQTVLEVYRTSGVPGFFRGYLSQFLTYAPYNMLGLPMSEWLLLQLFNNSDSDVAFLISFALGYGAAGVLTTPMDVIKTRIQLNAVDQRLYPNKTILAAAKQIYFEGVLNSFPVKHPHSDKAPGIITQVLKGLQGFFSGATPRAGWLAPRMALAFWLFGKFKGYLESQHLFVTEKNDDKPSPWGPNSP